MSKPASSRPKESFIVVMPTFNEQDKINKTITEWGKIVKKIKGSELLIINDGSTDQTSIILSKLSKRYKWLKTLNKKHEGHGKTIYRVYKEACKSKHTWIFQTDSDGHFNPNDFFKLWKMRNKSKFILGSRKDRQDPLFRILLSSVIRAYIFFRYFIYIKDANIPFRLMERKYLKKLLAKIPRGVFAPNIMIAISAKKDGNELFNIPIQHKNHHSSHLNFKKVVSGALQGLRELESFRKS